jgi:hypothetical protein
MNSYLGNGFDLVPPREEKLQIGQALHRREEMPPSRKVWLTSKANRAGLCLLLAIWAAGVSFGVKKMLVFEFTPAAEISSPSQWPSHSTVKPDGFAPTLLVAVHPRCACSRASLQELDEILRQCPRLAARILVYRSRQWRTDEAADAILPRQQAEAVVDIDGQEASRFGLATSGETLLYSASGKLLFKGGITGSRGHLGENAGQLAIIQFANGQIGNRDRTPTFGCSLLSFNQRSTL